ncbi:MAG TPA: hypothetical protein PK359_10430 [Burkholderiaceae bacterium]|nr:hypothetical protein [Burkholderiaceae bacterium]
MQAQTVAETKRIKVRDAATCRAWLNTLGENELGRLSAIERLLRNLAHSPQAPDLLLEIAEQARTAHLHELDSMASSLRGAAFPMPEAERRRLAVVCDGLALGRDLFARLHNQLLDESEAATRTVIPGTTTTLRAILPLARALDYQSRLILCLQSNGFEIEPAHWDKLCTYAGRVRASTFQDVALPDESPLLPSPTARALFTYPLLIALAQFEGRSDAERALVTRLARRWAAKVGFRIEPGTATHVSPNGPVMGLSSEHAVRMDSHKLMRRLQARREEIDALDTGAASAARLPRGMTLPATRSLLASLADRWSPGCVMVTPPDARLGEMRLRFGLPTLKTPERATQLSQPRLESREGQANWQSAANRAYIYGRFEQNTIIRMALGDEPGEDMLATWAAKAERATWVAIERQHSYFEREFASPVALGDLVTIVPPSLADQPAAVPGARSNKPARFMFGRVTSLSQRQNPDLKMPPIQRIGVAVWSGTPTLVGVRGGDDPFFHDAVLLSADSAGEPESLLLPAGRFSSQPSITLREPTRDVRVRLEAILETGASFERRRIHRLDN